MNLSVARLFVKAYNTSTLNFTQTIAQDTDAATVFYTCNASTSVGWRGVCGPMIGLTMIREGTSKDLC